MSNIEKIKAEIERLENMDYPCDTSEQATGFYNALDRISAFIDSLPEEKPSENLEEEIQGMYQAIFGTDIINRREMVYLETFDMLARHFAEWGAKHKESLQDQETCKENPDSFTDKPKEMSVDEAMAYLDEILDEIWGREPDDLEEAAEDSWALYEYRETPQGLYSSCYRDGFIAGAKWMESQMPMPENTVIFMKGVAEGRRLEREDRNDDKLPRYYGD